MSFKRRFFNYIHLFLFVFSTISIEIFASPYVSSPYECERSVTTSSQDPFAVYKEVVRSGPCVVCEDDVLLQTAEKNILDHRLGLDRIILSRAVKKYKRIYFYVKQSVEDTLKMLAEDYAKVQSPHDKEYVHIVLQMVSKDEKEKLQSEGEKLLNAISPSMQRALVLQHKIDAKQYTYARGSTFKKVKKYMELVQKATSEKEKTDAMKKACSFIEEIKKFVLYDEKVVIDMKRMHDKNHCRWKSILQGSVSDLEHEKDPILCRELKKDKKYFEQKINRNKNASIISLYEAVGDLEKAIVCVKSNNNYDE